MTRVRLVALFRWKLVDCSSQTCAPSTLSGEQVQVLDRLLNLASSEAEFQPSRYYCSDHCTKASSLSLTPHSPLNSRDIRLDWRTVRPFSRTSKIQVFFSTVQPRRISERQEEYKVGNAWTTRITSVPGRGPFKGREKRGRV